MRPGTVGGVRNIPPPVVDGRRLCHAVSNPCAAGRVPNHRVGVTLPTMNNPDTGVFGNRLHGTEFAFEDRVGRLNAAFPGRRGRTRIGSGVLRVAVPASAGMVEARRNPRKAPAARLNDGLPHVQSAGGPRKNSGRQLPSASVVYIFRRCERPQPSSETGRKPVSRPVPQTPLSRSRPVPATAGRPHGAVAVQRNSRPIRDRPDICCPCPVPAAAAVPREWRAHPAGRTGLARS